MEVTVLATDTDAPQGISREEVGHVRVFRVSSPLKSESWPMFWTNFELIENQFLVMRAQSSADALEVLKKKEQIPQEMGRFPNIVKLERIDSFSTSSNKNVKKS